MVVSHAEPHVLVLVLPPVPAPDRTVTADEVECVGKRERCTPVVSDETPERNGPHRTSHASATPVAPAELRIWRSRKCCEVP